MLTCLIREQEGSKIHSHGFTPIFLQKMSFCQSLSLDVSGRLKKWSRSLRSQTPPENQATFSPKAVFPWTKELRGAVNLKKIPETNSKFTPDKRVVGRRFGVLLELGRFAEVNSLLVSGRPIDVFFPKFRVETPSRCYGGFPGRKSNWRKLCPVVASGIMYMDHSKDQPRIVWSSGIPGFGKLMIVFGYSKRV